MKKYFFCLLLLLPGADVLAQECVILLHGMARSANSMGKMAEALKDEGYRTVNFSYPSTKFRIEEIAETYIPAAIESCGGAIGINFVTHSLGGIVLRKYLNDNAMQNLGRVVMLGPPNKGSEVVDRLRNVPGFSLLNGPAGMQLGTEQTSMPNSLGPVTYTVGIIAGTSTINPLLSLMLPDPDDGKVSVARTRLEGMSDHISVAVSHPFLMRNVGVIKQVKVFLKNGKFHRPAVEP